MDRFQVHKLGHVAFVGAHVDLDGHKSHYFYFADDPNNDLVIRRRQGHAAKFAQNRFFSCHSPDSRAFSLTGRLPGFRVASQGL